MGCDEGAESGCHGIVFEQAEDTNDEVSADDMNLTNAQKCMQFW